MQSSPAPYDTIEDAEPQTGAYPDTVEGMLQHIADTSLYYQVQIKMAKTNVKKNYFKKKLAKNNNKLYQFLVRTPNAYNPLMKYLKPTPADEAAVEYDKDGNEINRVGFSQVDEASFTEAVVEDLRYFEDKEKLALERGDLSGAEKARKQVEVLKAALASEA